MRKHFRSFRQRCSWAARLWRYLRLALEEESVDGKLCIRNGVLAERNGVFWFVVRPLRAWPSYLRTRILNNAVSLAADMLRLPSTVNALQAQLHMIRHSMIKLLDRSLHVRSARKAISA